MQINKTNNISFRASNLNILSMADNHGNFLGIPQVIETIKVNSDDIFEKGTEPSTKNILAIAGDYFMNPGQRGLLTDKTKTTGDIQYLFLLKLILATKKATGGANNFDALYGIGNHCFGAGEKWLYDKLRHLPGATTIISNIDLEKSPLMKNLTETTNKFVTSKIYHIPDDKNPKIKNQALFLSLTIPSTYYNHGNLKNTHFIDETSKNDASIKESDLKNTIELIQKKIKEFKEKYSNGAVIVLSHLGNPISKIIAENNPEIDIILNGHDHKNYIVKVGKTLIMSHGQNNEFIRATNISFDDKGKIQSIKEQKYETIPYDHRARVDREIEPFVQKALREDLIPLVEYTKESGKTEEMLYDNTIRYKNNVLANFITSGIKKAIEDIYPEVDSVGIPSTIIRNGLKSHDRRTTFNNIDLLDMFKGADQNVACLKIGTLTGEEIVKFIAENVRNNLKSKTRNAIIQWSDFQINRSLIENMLKGNTKKDYKEAIKFRNPKTGKFEPVNYSKKYTILMSEKYLIKKGINYKMPEKVYKKFKEIPETYEYLFRKYLNINNRKIQITDLHREKRIL